MTKYCLSIINCDCLLFTNIVFDSSTAYIEYMYTLISPIDTSALHNNVPIVDYALFDFCTYAYSVQKS